MSAELFAGERLEHPAPLRSASPDGRTVTYGIGANFDREAARSSVASCASICSPRAARTVPVSFVLDLACAGYLDGRVIESLKRTTQFVLSEPGTRFEFARANEDLRAHLDRVGFKNLFFGLDAKPPRITPELKL
jgi:hypothetical protein